MLALISQLAAKQVRNLYLHPQPLPRQLLSWSSRPPRLRLKLPLLLPLLLPSLPRQHNRFARPRRRWDASAQLLPQRLLQHLLLRLLRKGAAEPKNRLLVLMLLRMLALVIVLMLPRPHSLRPDSHIRPAIRAARKARAHRAQPALCKAKHLIRARPLHLAAC